jgi:hypothetical protein
MPAFAEPAIAARANAPIAIEIFMLSLSLCHLWAAIVAAAHARQQPGTGNFRFC